MADRKDDSIFTEITPVCHLEAVKKAASNYLAQESNRKIQDVGNAL
jgi:hypothetical protein